MRKRNWKGGKGEWFKDGDVPNFKATWKQLGLLSSKLEEVHAVLTPEERINIELMGFEAWLDALEKHEATILIGRIKGTIIASDILRRSTGVEKTKWWHTGLSDPKKRQ